MNVAFSQCTHLRQDCDVTSGRSSTRFDQDHGVAKQDTSVLISLTWFLTPRFLFTGIVCRGPVVANAQQTAGHPPYTYQSVVTYQCNSGFEMEGQASLTCGADSNWNHPPPRCKSKTRPSVCDCPVSCQYYILPPLACSYTHQPIRTLRQKRRMQVYLPYIASI